MTVTDGAAPGLRERKRRATRRAIQVATLELLAERGLEGVTVDAISGRADISPRTFFNYFGSIQAAMLGDPPELPAEEVIETFVHGDGPLLDDLAAVLVAAGEPTMADAEMLRLRHGLLRQYPHLFGLRMVTMRRFEEQIGEIIARRYERELPAEPPEERAQRARLVTMVAFAALRHAWTSWAGGEVSSPLTDQLRASFRQLRQLLA